MFVNQGNINFNSTTTDDWGDTQRIVLDIEALGYTQDWKIEVPQDNYQIDQIYGAELIEEEGKTYIYGSGWNQDLEQGEKTEVILIVNEINTINSSSSSSYAFSSAESGSSGDDYQEVAENSLSVASSPSINSQIVEDWYGGYKLEINLKAESYLHNWQADFSFPHQIRAVYGAELTDHGNGNYTISGENGNNDLGEGQSLTSVFIIDDYGQSATAPQFESADSQPEATPEISNPTLEPVAEPEVNQDVVENEISNPTLEPVAEPEVNQDVVENEVSNPTSEPAIEPDFNNDLTANPDGGGRIINVDQDFGGNLESAVAAANDGDVIQLGGTTYYTSGITIDKDITLDGQAGTIIDGQGTLQPILRLNPEASGATVQDLRLTNANQGVYAYRAFDLTLQNLEIDNIGLNQTIRDGQDNTGLVLNQVDGLQLLNSSIRDVGRKGVGINDTDGATISGLTVQNVNLAAQHAQSFDAAGVKLYNTNQIIVQDSYFSDINAFNIWSDTSLATTITGNVMENVGEDFLKPVFNTNVEIAGIYNEKSPNTVIKNNQNTAVGDFLGLNATEFSTETMVLENNNFSSVEVNTPDYWTNESAEKLIALTEDPLEADFSLIEEAYFAEANIG